MTEERQHIIDSHAIAKKIFAKAALSKLDLVPEVYAVWFTYYAGTVPKLSTEIESIISSGKKFDTSTHKDLYNRHLQTNEESEASQQVISETQQLLKGLFDEILDANSTTADYGKNLQKQAAQLGKATKVTDVKLIIKNLLKETSTAVTSGRVMQDKLAKATAKVESLEIKLQETQEEATIDILTGLRNRKAFDARIKELFNDFRRYGQYFSAIMVDIDFFKRFNDTYGHQTGDLVLQTVGKTLLRSLKGADFPARYGGEEFVVLLPETSLEHAIIVAEQLRIRIFMKKLEDANHPEANLKVNASFGVSFINKEDTIESVLGRADKALYMAKNTGRNRVCSELDLA